jgi:hypothetical protein
MCGSVAVPHFPGQKAISDDGEKPSPNVTAARFIETAVGAQKGFLNKIFGNISAASEISSQCKSTVQVYEHRRFEDRLPAGEQCRFKL